MNPAYRCFNHRMAGMVSSAVVQETVGKTLAGLVDKYVEKSNGKERMERLEMAHIKLEAALEISNKWQITDASLLRWRKKLKRAAQECDDTMHKCKQRILEKEEIERGVRSSFLPKRIAHFTKSFISSLFSHDNAEPSRSLLQRFEWYAHGATEFLRFVELGGTPHRYMLFDPLVRHLLAGKKMQHKIFRGNQRYLLLLVPYTAVDGGIEARLLVFHKDRAAPEKIFSFGLILQLSESTDIVGVILRCLQLFTPHFKSTAEVASKELSQLTIQQFSWVPNANCSHNEHWDNIHSVLTKWFRPNPLCCKQHRRGLCSSNTSLSSRLIDTSPEPVVGVYLERNILLSDYKRQLRTGDVEGERNSTGDPRSPYARLGLAFSPHSSSEGLLPAVESSAIEVINGEVQHYSHTNVSLEQVDEIMLPKVIDRLRQKAEETKYQMLWKSRHGAAFLVVEKAGMPAHVPSARRSTRKGKLRQRTLWFPYLEWTHLTTVFLNLWFPYAPGRLQSSIAEWVQKENGNATSTTT